MRVIAFTKVSAPYGWLGNMAPYPVTYGGQAWRTTEALFQALRFASDDPVRDLIREQKSPMAAKMTAKKHADKRVVTPLTQEDLDIMMMVLRLKVEQHPSLKDELLATNDALIVEDVTKRPGGTGLFWGAAWQGDKWEGGNALGLLWMALRDEIRDEPRRARQYILAHPEDCDPPHGLDLTPGSRDSLKVESLTEAFIEHGFDKNEPALVGYPLNGRIQLLSGTHRHEAAKRAGIMLPIKMHLRSVVEASWGLPEWLEKLIVDVPVKDLEFALVQDKGDPPGIDERVDLTKDLVYDESA